MKQGSVPNPESSGAPGGSISDGNPPSCTPAKTPLLKDGQFKRGLTFLHQLTSGMAGWLTFEQMQQGVDNLREAELAKPLELIARGRGYEIKGEFPLPKPEKKRGTAPRLDFLLVNRRHRIAIAIETKYKKKAKKMAGSLADDARRLQALTIEVLDAQIAAGVATPMTESIKGYTLVRAVLVVWHQSDIMEQLKLEPPVVKRQFLDLVSALLPEDVEANSEHFAKAMLGLLPTRPVARMTGALRPGSTYTYKRFWVACFIERPNWAQL